MRINRTIFFQQEKEDCQNDKKVNTTTVRARYVCGRTNRSASCHRLALASEEAEVSREERGRDRGKGEGRTRCEREESDCQHAARENIQKRTGM